MPPRKKILPEDRKEAKRRQDKIRSKTRVCIGHQITRWKALQDKLNINHEGIAKILLDLYDSQTMTNDDEGCQSAIKHEVGTDLEFSPYLHVSPVNIKKELSESSVSPRTPINIYPDVEDQTARRSDMSTASQGGPYDIIIPNITRLLYREDCNRLSAKNKETIDLMEDDDDIHVQETGTEFTSSDQVEHSDSSDNDSVAEDYMLLNNDIFEDDYVPTCSTTGRPVRRAAAISMKRGRSLLKILQDDEQNNQLKDGDFEVSPSSSSDEEENDGDILEDVPDNIGKQDDKKCDLYFVDDENQFECELCDFKCTMKIEMKQHRVQIHKISTAGVHGCDTCGEIYATLILLLEHKKKYHQIDDDLMHPCHVCGALLTRQKVNKHFKSLHCGKRPNFVCGTCNRTFVSKYIYIHHCMKHDNPDHHVICPEQGCNKRLNASSVRKHVAQCHKQQRNFSCSFQGCTKRFFSGWNLKVHMRQHTGDQPFVCHLCDYTAKQNVCLKLHMKSHKSVE